jgi:hypothetical protein
MLFVRCAAGMVVCFWMAVAPAAESSFDIYMRCFSMRDTQAKIKYCLANVNRVDAESRAAMYDVVSGVYSEIHDWDRAIEFEEKAAVTDETRSRPKPSDAQTPNGLTYKQLLLFFYSSRSHSYYKLAVLENIKSLDLEIHGNQLEDATVYAAKALLHASKAIVIHPINHEAYAIRAEINARYCKADEAQRDRSEAIDLAVRQHDEEAAEKYRDIDPDDCTEDLRGRLN